MEIDEQIMALLCKHGQIPLDPRWLAAFGVGDGNPKDWKEWALITLNNSGT